jgi:hypothetical protein
MRIKCKPERKITKDAYEIVKPEYILRHLKEDESVTLNRKLKLLIIPNHKKAVRYRTARKDSVVIEGNDREFELVLFGKSIKRVIEY